MFESLSEGLQSAFKSLRGKGKLTEANMREGLATVERAMLEADVSYPVLQAFMAHVTEQALGQRVLLSLRPDQELVRIVNDELVSLLGPVDNSLHLKEQGCTILMLCGLQGSGKTTTCGKLAQLLLEQKIKPMLVAADLQRPAAIEQLKVIGKTLGVEVYADLNQKDPVAVCQEGVKKAQAAGAKVVILDTAGRLAIDEALMQELQRIDKRVSPDQVYLVVDGMTGQDAVNSAGAFNAALELDGVIMTKLDGDARGGALLSVKHVTGVPIKFIGTGEKLDALEPFYPNRLASRILGMGDVLSLIERAQQTMTGEEEDPEKLQQRLMKGQFTLEDFLSQLQKIKQMGPLSQILEMLPGVGQQLRQAKAEISDDAYKHIEAIIYSMTADERRNPEIIGKQRTARIAKGSGRTPQEVKALLKQFEEMQKMMAQMGKFAKKGKMPPGLGKGGFPGLPF